MTALNRRAFLTRSGALGCSAAASPWLTPVALASAPWDGRLIVIILRGGLDGIDAVRPIGDPAFSSRRAGASLDDAQIGDSSGFYALHPALSGLAPMWQAGDLAVAHAVSTPYRGRRSHFDGQDLLEAGAGFAPGIARPRDGWLNRMLQSVPGVATETAFAVGQEQMFLLTGDAPHRTWAPEAQLSLTPQAELLLSLLYADDPLFSDAAAEAVALSEEMSETPTLAELAGDSDGAEAMVEMMSDAGRRPAGGHLRVAEFVAARLRAETRIAAFSLNGWDTHRNQARGLDRALGRLAEVLQTLQVGLGPVWGQTAVLAMTEFGRTVAMNGTGGTDHGTGGAIFLAGGAVRGATIHGTWPGLDEAALYERRDLMPTADVRAYAAKAMEELFGLNRSVLEGSVFPGLEIGGLSPVLS